jgi:hypothetical protein
MKTARILLMLVALSGAAKAESPFIREMTQLQQQRDRALAAAGDPIQRSYRTNLEALLRRASQANDLQAVGVLRAELEKAGGAAPGVAAQPSQPANAAAVDVLTSRLVNTKWVWFGKETLTLLPDGKAEWSTGKQIWPWKVTSVGRRTIEGVAMSKNIKFTMTFEHDLKTGVIESEGHQRATHLITE